MSLAAQTHEGRSEPRVQYSKEAKGPNRYISRASQLLLHYGRQRRGDGSPAQWGNQPRMALAESQRLK